MSETYQFKCGPLKGEIKVAESSDNPGEIMILSMPMAANVDLSGQGGKLADCPLCGRKAWASPLLLQGAEMFKGRAVAACTECSMRANLKKGEVPRWMEVNGHTPEGLLRPILALFGNE